VITLEQHKKTTSKYKLMIWRVKDKINWIRGSNQRVKWYHRYLINHTNKIDKL